MAQFAELSEQHASGEIARIYAEIRHTYGAPYVSSLQRHFATFPGVLEWAWGIVAPGFHSGLIPRAAWQIARDADHESAFEPLSVEALRALGVDERDEQAIRNVCENFVRVAPLNLLFAGCIRVVLEGADTPSGPMLADSDWQPPSALPPLPSMCDVATLAPREAQAIEQLSTSMGTQVFVPGLYRMLAHWPGYLQHIAANVGPRLRSASFRARGERLAAQIVAAAPTILESLPTPPARPMPDARLIPGLLDAIATYRRTSPEMVLVGTLLLAQLPSR